MKNKNKIYHYLCCVATFCCSCKSFVLHILESTHSVYCTLCKRIVKVVYITVVLEYLMIIVVTKKLKSSQIKLKCILIMIYTHAASSFPDSLFPFRRSTNTIILVSHKLLKVKRNKYILFLCFKYSIFRIKTVGFRF